MTAAYIECVAGFNIERLLGAWFDLGLQEEEWQKYMTKIGIQENVIDIHRTTVSKIAATAVSLNPFELPNNLTLSDIEKIIDHWELPEKV
ncbi:MAG: DUF111 family protein, partial [Bacillota bacterium]|nr:DUF111 family protein [Bacillota bacterium]